METENRVYHVGKAHMVFESTDDVRIVATPQQQLVDEITPTSAFHKREMISARGVYQRFVAPSLNGLSEYFLSCL